jgi:hypothetical protein
MTTRARRFLATILLVVAGCGSATGEESVPTILERQTQELLDAISAGDASVWERYLDPACWIVDEGGDVLTKKELVGDLRPMTEGVSGVLRVTEFQAAHHGDVATTTYVAEEDQNYHGQSLKCSYRTSDTWKKTSAGWRLIASQTLALRADPPSVALAPQLLDEYIGVYRLTPAIAFEIHRSGGGLEGQQTDRKAVKLLAEAPDVLFVPGRPRIRYIIRRGADGKVTGFAQRREAWDLVWTRVAAPSPKP